MVPEADTTCGHNNVKCDLSPFIFDHLTSKFNGLNSFTATGARESVFSRVRIKMQIFPKVNLFTLPVRLSL